MFDKYLVFEYKVYFFFCNLYVFFVELLFIYFIYYIGDDGYVSDIEILVVWNNEYVKIDWDCVKFQKMWEQQVLSCEVKNLDVFQFLLDSVVWDEF